MRKASTMFSGALRLVRQSPSREFVLRSAGEGAGNWAGPPSNLEPAPVPSPKTCIFKNPGCTMCASDCNLRTPPTLPPPPPRRPLTVSEDVEWFSIGVHRGQAGGLWGDGSPSLQCSFQGGRPVRDHAQLLPPHGQHLGSLRLWLVWVGLLNLQSRKREAA